MPGIWRDLRWDTPSRNNDGYLLGTALDIDFTAKDARGAPRRGGAPDTEYIATVNGSFTMPPGLNQQEFYRVLNDVVLRYCEDHERMEWFKINGVCFDDPHGETHHTLPPEELHRQAEVLLGRKL